MPLAHEFALPDLGEGLEEAIIVEWLVDVGATVEINDPLCTVETSKTEVTLPSPFRGRVIERCGERGDTVPVGHVLVRVEDGDESGGNGAMLVGYGPRATTSRRRRSPAAVVERIAAHDGGRGPGDGVGGGPARGESTAGTVVPLTAVRARLAERMARAHATIPSASGSVWVDCTNLTSALPKLQDRAGHERSVRVTPFGVIAAVVVRALADWPVLNSTFVDHRREIALHSHVDLSVGVATEAGLLVPTVRHADELPAVELWRELERVITRARAGRLAPADAASGTFTLTNFGSLGLDDGQPIINPPQAAILGLGAIKARPVVDDGLIEARPTAKVTCVFDHRVCDGAEVGGFLTAVRTALEALDGDGLVP